MSGLDSRTIEELGRAYLDGVDISGTPDAKAMVRDAARRVHIQFRDLSRRITITFTEQDPYPNFDALKADVLNNRHMAVYTGESVTPLWNERTNWMARAVHDYDHVEADVDFSLLGEFAAYRHAASKAPLLAPIVLSEVALQAASFHLQGHFSEGPQKLVRGAARHDRLIERALRPNPPPPPPLVAQADAAATLATFMPATDVVRMLAFEGVSEERAVLLASAALLQSEALG